MGKSWGATTHTSELWNADGAFLADSPQGEGNSGIWEKRIHMQDFKGAVYISGQIPMCAALADSFISESQPPT